MGGRGARVGGCPTGKNNYFIFFPFRGAIFSMWRAFFLLLEGRPCFSFCGSFSPFRRGGGLFSLCGENFKLVSTYKISAGAHALAAKIVTNISPWGKLGEIVRHIKSANTFWSTYSYNVEKINEMIRCSLLNFSKFCVNFLKNCRLMHFLNMIILRGELMRFIIYVDNVQQYMRTCVHTRKIVSYIWPNLVIL